MVVDRLLDAVRVAANRGIGVLLVEQHIHKALAIADRAYILRRGEVQLQGSADEIRARVDEIQSAYMTTEAPAPAVQGPPYDPNEVT